MPGEMRIRAADRELTIELVDDMVNLGISVTAESGTGPGPGCRSGLWPDGGSRPGMPSTTWIGVSARSLIAAVRAAWADDRYGACDPLEPGDRGRCGCEASRPSASDSGWGGRAWGRWRPGAFDDPYDPFDDGYSDDLPWDRGADVLPFTPPPSPPPSRSGQAWTAEEDDTVRTMWLAAPEGANKDSLIREVAQALERTCGGVGIRLARAGCDPTKPGFALTFPDPPSPDPAETLRADERPV